MPTEYTKKATEDVRNWFRNHVAEHYELKGGPSPVHMLRFSEPGTSCYFLEYIFTNGTLFVRGDLGEATYCWHYSMGFWDLAGVDLSYMSGKCQASEDGRRFKGWSCQVAYDYLKDMLVEYSDENDDVLKFLDPPWKGIECDDFSDAGDYSDEQWNAAKVNYAESHLKKIEEEGGSWDSEEGWAHWLNEGDNGHEYFGQDHWEWTYGVGHVPAHRLIAHHLGLKLALAQVKGQQQKAHDSICSYG